MDTLPQEIQKLVISKLPISDRRNLIRCTTYLNILKDCMYKKKKFFENMQNIS